MGPVTGNHRLLVIGCWPHVWLQSSATVTVSLLACPPSLCTVDGVALQAPEARPYICDVNIIAMAMNVTDNPELFQNESLGFNINEVSSQPLLAE